MSITALVFWLYIAVSAMLLPVLGLNTWLWPAISRLTHKFILSITKSKKHRNLCESCSNTGNCDMYKNYRSMLNGCAKKFPSRDKRAWIKFIILRGNSSKKIFGIQLVCGNCVVQYANWKFGVYNHKTYKWWPDKVIKVVYRD